MARLNGINRILLLVTAAWLLAQGSVCRAGTTGTIAGQVLDQYGDPVAEAVVTVLETDLEATTDAEGNFSILSVPPGTYSVRGAKSGYQSFTLTENIVSSDRTTRVYLQLGDANLLTEEMVVIAEKQPVDLNTTSSLATLTTKEIENLPVQELEDLVNLQAGVIDGHFRGGRKGEVQYQVDGVSMNNAFDNAPSMKIDRSLLQAVQVISGTFDAEYGQAMSGVVNAVLKQGSPSLRIDTEVYSGGFFFPGREKDRRTDDTVLLTGTQNFQMTISGPLPLPKSTYLVSGRRYLFDDYITAKRVYNPTDSDSLATGDGSEESLGYNQEWSGVVKLTTEAFEGTKLNYQALFNSRESRPTNYDFRFMPDALSIQRQYSISHGLDWNQRLGDISFLDFSVRQNILSYRDYLYEDAYDPRYDEPEELNGDGTFGDYFYQGVQTNHYRQRTNTYLFKGSVVSQINGENQAKTGFELSLPEVKFGNDVDLVYSNNILERHVNEFPDYPGLQTYYPVMGAAYVQDQFERQDLVVRFGARLDYFDARSTVPSDPSNPANAIAGAPESHPERTSIKSSVSPRLGVAYPVNDTAAIHFAYGHFTQFPSVNTMFSNSNYAVLENLLAGDDNFTVFGNPDVKPETTVQYEVGYKQAITDDLGVEMTVFYKDIRDLLGVEFIETYTGAVYTRLTNTDFGNITGATLTLDHRNVGPLSLSLDYTWQQALGNASDPTETANRAAMGEDPRPRLLPFNWDQRHTVNMTVALFKPRDYSISLVSKFGSGLRFTPKTENAFGFGASTNSGTKPSAFLVDLRAEKILGANAEGGIFLRVFNLLDARYFNGSVYETTGSPFYARDPSRALQVSLEDPTMLYPPRRIEAGVRWSFGGM